MSQQITYRFSTSSSSNDTLVFTVNDTPSSFTIGGVAYQGYAVTDVTGQFNGETITGLLGPAGDQNDTGNAGPYDNIIFVDNTQGANGSSLDGIDFNGLGFTTTSAHYAIYSSAGAFSFQSANVTMQSVTLDSTNEPTVVCFLAGTTIRTPHGEVAVETLKRGDLLLTAEGKVRPVIWIGRQTVRKRFANPLRSFPIRIRASALGQNVPSRDLIVSPDHALLVEDVLIHAGALVNGTSITRETVVPEVFVYYHVELDDHALILAEGAPAETFVDNVDRSHFDNWAEHRALFPDGKATEELLYPRAKSRRQVPPHIRAALDARALEIGVVANAAA